MGNTGFKVIAVLLALGRHSKRHVNFPLSIAIFSTLVTIGLVALYLMHETPEFP
jgi:predicted RND superfamily exporter protein